jgi:hypothetical protein
MSGLTKWFEQSCSQDLILTADNDSLEQSNNTVSDISLYEFKDIRNYLFIKTNCPPSWFVSLTA